MERERRLEHDRRIKAKIARTLPPFAAPVTVRQFPLADIVLIPGRSRERCTPKDCIPAERLIARRKTPDGVVEDLLLDSQDTPFRSVRVVNGTTGGIIVLQARLKDGSWNTVLVRCDSNTGAVDYRRPRNLQLLDRRMQRLVSSNDTVFSSLRKGLDLELTFHPLGSNAPEQTVLLRNRNNYETQIYGLGARHDGTFWVHWGNHLLLFDEGFRARSASLARYRKVGEEWAGAWRPLEKPEGLSIGIEVGPRRKFRAVTFASIAKRAKPWPSTPAPTDCRNLPAVPELKTWNVHPESPCPSGGRPNYRNPPPPFVPYRVINTLGDGTKIVDGRERGCIRVRKQRCPGMK